MLCIKCYIIVIIIIHIVNCSIIRPKFIDQNECQFDKSFIYNENNKVDLYLSSVLPTIAIGSLGSKTNPFTTLTDAWAASLNYNNNNISVNIRVLSGVYSYSLASYPKSVPYEYISGWNDPISISSHPSVDTSQPNIQIVGDDIYNPPLFTSRIPSFYNLPNTNLWQRVLQSDEIFANESIRTSINSHIEYDDKINLFRSTYPMQHYFPMNIVLKPLQFTGFIHLKIPKTNKIERVALVMYYNLAELVSKYETRLIANNKNVVPNYVGAGLHYDYVRCWKWLIQEGQINETDVDIASLSDGLKAFYNNSIPDSHSCHLYIRLDRTSNAVNVGFDSYSVDPNHHQLSITDHFQFVFTRLSRMRIANINFEVAKMQFTTVLDVLIENCMFYISGSRIDINSAQRVSIRKSMFTMGFPKYLYWTDLKNGFDVLAELIPRSGNQGPASSLHESALLIRHQFTRCILIENNYIHKSWFGIYLTHCDACFVYHNKLEWIHNDAIMYSSSAVTSTDIAYNRITDCYNGLSQVPNGHFEMSQLTLPPNDNRTIIELSASIALHHNIVYLPYSERWPIGKLRPSNETSPSGFNGDPFDLDYGFAVNCAFFIGHSSGIASAFQLYNNLLVTNTHFVQAVALSYNNDGQQKGYVVNNIVINLDPKGLLARPFNLDPAFINSDYKGFWLDGNVWYRLGNESGPSFDSWYGIGDGTTYLSLQDLCNTSQVYDTSYLYNNLLFLVAYYEFDSPSACEYRQIHSQICLSTNLYYNYRSLRDVLCDHPRIKVERNINNTYFAVEPISQSGLSVPLQCVNLQCRTNYMGNSQYKDVGITSARLFQQLTARVKLFQQLPDSTSSFIGACTSDIDCDKIGSEHFRNQITPKDTSNETGVMKVIIASFIGFTVFLTLLSLIVVKRKLSKQRNAVEIRKNYMLDDNNSSSVTQLHKFNDSVNSHVNNNYVNNDTNNDINVSQNNTANNNWLKYYTNDGIPYFYNSITQESKWTV